MSGNFNDQRVLHFSEHEINSTGMNQTKIGIRDEKR